MPLIVGAFEQHQAAARAVDQLMAAGFASDQVTVHSKESSKPSLTAEDDTVPGATAEDRDRAATPSVEEQQQPGGGMPLGLAVAGTLGASGGTIGGTMGATGTGGYAGCLLPTFLAAGVPEDQARWYSDQIQTGKYVVAVKADSTHEAQARTTLAVAGADFGIREKA